MSEHRPLAAGIRVPLLFIPLLFRIIVSQLSIVTLSISPFMSAGCCVASIKREFQIVRRVENARAH
jgi:hypothetical protein